MMKHVLTGVAVLAVAGAVASCGGGTDTTRVVYTPATAAVVYPQPPTLRVYERAPTVVYEQPNIVRVPSDTTVVIPEDTAAAPDTAVVVPKRTVIVPNDTVVVDSNQIVVYEPVRPIIVQTIDTRATGQSPYYR